MPQSVAAATHVSFVSDPRMDVTETIVALGACALVLMVDVALDRRPWRPGKLNYIAVMVICLAACLVLGRYLLSLIRWG